MKNNMFFFQELYGPAIKTDEDDVMAVIDGQARRLAAQFFLKGNQEKEMWVGGIMGDDVCGRLCKQYKKCENKANPAMCRRSPKFWKWIGGTDYSHKGVWFQDMPNADCEKTDFQSKKRALAMKVVDNNGEIVSGLVDYPVDRKDLSALCQFHYNFNPVDKLFFQQSTYSSEDKMFTIIYRVSWCPRGSFLFSLTIDSHWSIVKITDNTQGELSKENDNDYSGQCQEFDSTLIRLQLQCTAEQDTCVGSSVNAVVKMRIADSDAFFFQFGEEDVVFQNVI